MFIFAIAMFYSSFFVGAPACPGDTTGDGRVNILDFSLTAANFGKGTAPYQYGDANGDSIVSMADLEVIQANYGAVCSCRTG